MNCFAERRLIRPQKSNTEQLGQKWTQYKCLIQVWIWIVIKYLTHILSFWHRITVVEELRSGYMIWIYIFCFCAIHCCLLTPPRPHYNHLPSPQPFIFTNSPKPDISLYIIYKLCQGGKSEIHIIEF